LGGLYTVKNDRRSLKFLALTKFLALISLAHREWRPRSVE
jgi:hypothetical protein